MDSLYFEAFDSLPGLVCLVNATTHLIHDCNAKFDKALGFSRNEIKSMKFIDSLVKENDKAYLQRLLGQVIPFTELDEVEMCTLEGNYSVN